MRNALGLVAIVTLSSIRSRAAADTVVTLSFDDTFEDQVQAGAMLVDQGLRGTFFVNSPRIDQPNYMTSADLDSLYAAGHEIAGHTLHHDRLATQSHDEVQRQICDDRVALLARGYAVTDFAYPKSSQNADVRAVAAACGYNSARSASGLHSQGFQICPGCAPVETIPPQDPFLIRTPNSIKSQNTLDDLKQNVLVAEAQGGGWVPFVIHHVCDGCNPDAVSPAILRDFIAWLAARQGQGTTVKTIHEVIGGSVQPAVSGPWAVPYIGPDGNLLRNASFEDDAFASDLGPDCWRLLPSSNGTMISGTVSSKSHSGSAAAQLVAQPGASGASSITSLQDAGQCAPPALPGDVFHVTAWYQSTDAVRLAAYYRTATGWWVNWTTGPPLAAASTYAQAEWDTPPAPAGATGISVGIVLQGAGSVLIDDVTLLRISGPDPSADAGTPGPIDDADLGVANLGVADLGVADLGVAGLGADLGMGPSGVDSPDLSTGTEPPDGSGCMMGAGPRTPSLVMLVVASLAAMLTRRRRRVLRRAS